MSYTDDALIQRANEILERGGWNSRYAFEAGIDWGWIVRLWDSAARDDLGDKVQFDFADQAKVYCDLRNGGADHQKAWVAAVLLLRGDPDEAAARLRAIEDGEWHMTADEF